MDNWITATLAGPLRAAADPLAIDLGYGATPITAIELSARLRTVRADVRVLGLEIDPQRVADAVASADPPALHFERGGFEFAGHRPALVRVANVLRQYDEDAAFAAWQMMRGGLAEGGLIVEGTCDEVGRRCVWVLLGEEGPRTLTLACKVDTIERPSDLAERLPKALIHHNVPGDAIHAFLRDFDAAWDNAAPMGTFGKRQRWISACANLATAWPVEVARSRYGEITVSWNAVAPE